VAQAAAILSRLFSFPAPASAGRAQPHQVLQPLVVHLAEPVRPALFLSGRGLHPDPDQPRHHLLEQSLRRGEKGLVAADPAPAPSQSHLRVALALVLLRRARSVSLSLAAAARRALKGAYASLAETAHSQQAAFVRCQEKRLPPELVPARVLAVVKEQVCLAQTSSRVHRGLVRLRLEAMYLVFPEVTFLQAV
jgi:hypothetical protein